MRNRVIRIAIVGSGNIAIKSHIPCYRNNKDAKVVAVVDTDTKKTRKTARKFKIETSYNSIDKLFSSIEIDAISVCTPPDSHAYIATEALKRGVNVLCEKPLTNSVDKGLQMVKAAENSDGILMVGFNRRFNPNYCKLKYMINRGRMGHTHLIEYWSLQRSPLMGWSKSPWYYQSGIGGSLLDQGPHVFDMLNWFLGKPHSVYAYGGVHSHSPVDEFCVAIIRYENGKVGIGVMSWLSPVRIEKLGIHGTGGTFYVSPSFLLEVGPEDLDISLWKAVTTTLANRFKNIIRGTSVNTYQLEIDYFINCIKTRKKPFLDGWSGLNALAVTEAAAESIEKGLPVLVRDL